MNVAAFGRTQELDLRATTGPVEHHFGQDADECQSLGKIFFESEQISSWTGSAASFYMVFSVIAALESLGKSNNQLDSYRPTIACPIIYDES